jgi:hypothetical protein
LRFGLSREVYCGVSWEERKFAATEVSRGGLKRGGREKGGRSSLGVHGGSEEWEEDRVWLIF